MAGLLNVCRFNATSSGTGDFVVASVVTGYQTPASAGAVNGTVYRYRAESPNLSEWEVGYGAYTAGSTTLARTTVMFSSTGSKVSFSAAPQVAIVALAEDIGGPILLGTGTASSSSSLDFTNLITSEYDSYVLFLENITPATDDSSLYLRVGTGATPTWQATSYQWGANRFSTNPTLYAGNGSTLDSLTTAIALSTPGASNGIDNGGSSVSGLSGQIFISAKPSTRALFRVQSSFMRSDNNFIFYHCGGTWDSTTTITSLRLLMSGGDIASGTARLYGVKKT